MFFLDQYFFRFSTANPSAASKTLIYSSTKKKLFFFFRYFFQIWFFFASWRNAIAIYRMENNKTFWYPLPNNVYSKKYFNVWYVICRICTHVQKLKIFEDEWGNVRLQEFLIGRKPQICSGITCLCFSLETNYKMSLKLRIREWSCQWKV